MTDDDYCTVCGAPVERRCRCVLGDRICPNGHHWHFCFDHGTRVESRSDHSDLRCSCGRWVDAGDEEAVR